MSYKYIEHTADVGIEAKGSTVGQMFEEGARALFGIMTDLEKIEPQETLTFELEADNIEHLYVDFLSHLIAMKDVNEAFYNDFEVEIKDNKLNCTAKGEKIDSDRHELKTEVKAVTYYGMKYEKDKNKIIVVVDV